MTKPENPRAFPLSVNDLGDAGYDGMSLRDYFAATALQGIIGLGNDACMSLETKQGETIADAVAKNAYYAADAMLKAREND